MSHRAVCLIAIGLALSGFPGDAATQTLEEAVEGAGSGEVVFRFPVKDGVEICGDGGIRVGERWQRGAMRRGWQDRCTEGEGQVRMDLREGEIRDLDLEPGGQAADVDLGLRSANEAAAFLINLARTSPRSRVAKDAIMPAMIALDVGLWPELAEMARDRGLDDDVREQAIFWLGQEVADAGNDYERGPDDDDPEADVRDAAVFALSQRSNIESVPILMELARTSPHASVRRSAVFWLSQTDDVRVIDFFEAVLRGG